MPADTFITVILNGSLVNAEDARVSIFDRGFLYGDGLFETIRVQEGRPFRWDRHFLRLTRGMLLLNLRLPCDDAELRGLADRLIDVNRCVDGVMRLTISRGSGRRGLSSQGADFPTLAMSLHFAPDRTKSAGLRLITSPYRVLANDPLAAVKSASKLGYVLARTAAATLGADDALILNHREEVAETTSSNLFWIKGGELFTAAPEVGILPGVARGIVLELAPGLGFPIHQVASGTAELLAADGVFTTNVVRGVMEVLEIDGHTINRSECFSTFARAFEELVKEEVG